MLTFKFEKHRDKTHPAPQAGLLQPAMLTGRERPGGAAPAPLTQVLVVDAQVIVELGADLGDQRQVLELGELLGRRQLRHGRVRDTAEAAP